MSDRNQCAHPLAHFITNWRLCEPIEYTTALADHGITYTDYCRLIVVLENFLDGIKNDSRRRSVPSTRWWGDRGRQNDTSKMDNDFALKAAVSSGSIINSAREFMRTEHHAADLNKLLADVSRHWQARNIPAMVCVSSFSIFAPYCISESHIQILHVQLKPVTPSQKKIDHRLYQPLNFVNPFGDGVNPEEISVSARPKLERKDSSPTQSPTSISASGFHHHQIQLKDCTRPWPLWPNAIPKQKRDVMNRHADRYGVDPYFRAYMRANVNSRTKSTSYAKYMIEQEDDPFINTHIGYVDSPSRNTSMKILLPGSYKNWRERYSVIVNRKSYEHNRRLECRKTAERGSRLRIARFGFKRPIYPPHTPEMEGLGLSKEKYHTIISKIDDIRRNHRSGKSRCGLGCMTWLRVKRRVSTEEALTKVSEYVRQINTQDRRIVWTIEKIPRAYDRGFGRDGKEWEISAWNGEDALDLLIQLERYGIIEKKLDIGDDESMASMCL